MQAKILFAIFLGGAAGSIARFSVFLAVEQAGVPNLLMELLATSIVNLAGAAFLGFVQSAGFKASEKAKAFWGTGFAGGFTTMSGLALITAGSDLGLSEIGYLYWLAVLLQFVLGILAYWLTRKFFENRRALVS